MKGEGYFAFRVRAILPSGGTRNYRNYTLSITATAQTIQGSSPSSLIISSSSPVYTENERNEHKLIWNVNVMNQITTTSLNFAMGKRNKQGHGSFPYVVFPLLRVTTQLN